MDDMGDQTQEGFGVRFNLVVGVANQRITYVAAQRNDRSGGATAVTAEFLNELFTVGHGNGVA
ncbi:MAG TPA: hypothetical protein VFA89_07490 [Terriglobales bacterium]|nr:hypothetical protein [Terriglobales bacterium]